MPRRSRRTIELALFLLLSTTPVLAQDHPQKISEDEIKKYVRAPDCEGVAINTLQYFDFTGDGVEEAVVMASTCATGSAGPDVHAVLRLQPDGSLTGLKIPELTKKERAALFGSVFYNLDVKGGQLVETYHDESGRRDPLVVKYRWDTANQEFQVSAIAIAPRYKASFDCDQADTPVGNAVCYSSTAASLDLAVDESYKTWRDHLNDRDRDILMKEQRDWLRKRDIICGADRGVFGCLETLYRARLLELQYFRPLHR